MCGDLPCYSKDILLALSVVVSYAYLRLGGVDRKEVGTWKEEGTLVLYRLDALEKSAKEALNDLGRREEDLLFF